MPREKKPKSKTSNVRSFLLTPRAIEAVEKARNLSGMSQVEFVSRILEWAAAVPPADLLPIFGWAIETRSGHNDKPPPRVSQGCQAA